MKQLWNGVCVCGAAAAGVGKGNAAIWRRPAARAVDWGIPKFVAQHNFFMASR